jgi:hypothetical protein
MGLFRAYGRCRRHNGPLALNARGVTPDAMTNPIAAFLAVLILVFLAYDGLRHDWESVVFLMRKFVELTEYLAFWR